jgi:hypothetical protein
MPTLCRAYSGLDDARAAVQRLLAGGDSGEEIRILSSAPEHDHRDDAVGRFAGEAVADPPVGTFAGAERSSREPMGAYGSGSTGRRGGFGDLDRETITSYTGGVRHVRMASHRDLKRMLTDAGLDDATASADVRALHDGRVLVLVRAGDADAAAQALDL